MGLTPTSGPTPSGRQGSGPQPLPPPVQGASTAQLTLLGLCSWAGSGMGLENWQRQRGWKASLPAPRHTRHTRTHLATQACAAPG